MSDEIMDEVNEVVEAAKAPGTFSIVNLLRDRAYPKDSVVVFLDEASAYAGGEIDKKIKTTADDAEIERLHDERDAIIEKMKQSAVTFYIKGITESARADLLKQAKKKYPVEYNKEINPINGEWTKEEKDSPERDELFTDLLWHSSIEKVEDVNGNIQENLSYAEVRDMRTMFPLASSAKITEAIEKLRVATAVFMMEVNEDFLQKP